jgi:Ca2+-binding EF-hand superfamily protein
MDSDGSGQLDFSEFTHAVNDYKVGLSEQEADTLFKMFDRNHDGTINFDEFMNTLLGDLN